MKIIQIGDCKFTPALNQIERASATIRLEKRVADVLNELLRRRGEVVSKDELLDRVWGGAFVSDHSVAISISELRRALGDDAKSPRYIQTVPKRGYRLLVDGDMVDARAAPNVNARIESAQPAAVGGNFVRWRSAVAACSMAAVAATGLVAGFGGPSEQSTFREQNPIVFADICYGDSGSQVEDMAYGFAEIFSVSLNAASNRPIIRRRNAHIDNESNRAWKTALLADGGIPLWIDGALIQAGDELILTLELRRASTDEVVWSRRYPVETSTVDSVARLAASEAAAAARDDLPFASHAPVGES